MEYLTLSVVSAYLMRFYVINWVVVFFVYIHRVAFFVSNSLGKFLSCVPMFLFEYLSGLLHYLPKGITSRLLKA